MKINDILSKLQPLKNLIAQHAVIIFVICVAGVFGFMTFRISSCSNKEPNEFQIEERKNSLKTVRLDDEAVKKIQELQDQNISIESLFNNGRANPFE